MKPLIILLALFLAACSSGGKKFYPQPFNPTGIVQSEYRGAVQVAPGQGYIKGWVPAADKAVVVGHANPAVGARIYVIDKAGTKHDRTITKLEPITLANGNPARSDTVVATINEPWPDGIAMYQVATARPGVWWVTHADLTRSLRRAPGVSNPAIAELWGDETTGSRPIVPGESGLPWFDFSGYVVSHTTGGNWGVGPDYAHPDFRPQFIDAIEKP